MMFEVLGPVQLRGIDGEIVEVPEHKVRLLLAALLVRRGEPVATDTLIEQAWGDAPPGQPRKVLRAKISQLRSVLDRAEVGARERLTNAAGSYRLAIDHDELDADLFVAEVARCRALRSATERVDGLTEALRRWDGPAYGDLADQAWLSAEIAALEDAKASAVELLADALLDVGQPDEALGVARPALDEHPLREGLVAVTMRSQYLLGRQVHALGTYEELRVRLADELGADPSPMLRDLHTRILRHDPALDSGAVPSVQDDTDPSPDPAPGSRDPDLHQPRAIPDPPPGNLPAETSPFFGREREVEDIGQLMEHHRLVTLTGIGGVGKTRLAVHVARLWATERSAEEDLPRQAWFVDLTELRSAAPSAAEGQAAASRIAELVAVTLELPRSSGDGPDLLGRLAARLGSTGNLVVLDNAEHVVVEVATFVKLLLSRQPDVRVLATSRERLGLPDEQISRVRPLPVTLPPEDASDDEDDASRPSTSDATSDGAATDELPPAAAFFVARARATQPDLSLAGDDVRAVIELCRRLDGLPLALELAASQVGALSIHDLLTRVSDRLQLLARPGGGAPRRQQTLRGMLDWSWSLLDERERSLLRRLAVVPGTWRLETIEAVCADESPSGHLPAAEVVPTLTRLVDRSLVTVLPAGTTRRYGMLESVATYAGEKLADAGERAEVSHRHVAYHVALTAAAESELHGPHQQEWLQQLTAERAHLRQAFEEALNTGDGASATALAGATFWARWMTGWDGGLAEELAAAAACPGPHDARHAQVATLAAALGISAADAAPSSHAEDPVATVEAALAAFSDDDEGRLARAQVQWFAAASLIAEGHGDRGSELADEAITILLEQGEDAAAAIAAVQRDWHLVERWSEPPRGLPDGRDPARILHDAGDAYGLTQAWAVSHLVAVQDGDMATADEITTDALAACQRLGLDAEASYWLVVSALSHARHGRTDQARALLGDARTAAQTASFTAGFAFIDRAGDALARTEGGEDVLDVEVQGAGEGPEIAGTDDEVERRWIARLLGSRPQGEHAPTS